MGTLSKLRYGRSRSGPAAARATGIGAASGGAARSRAGRAGATGFLAVGLLAGLFASGCAAILNQPEPETVTIGVDIEQTGSGEELGNVLVAAIELRVEQVNEQGLLGDRRLDLRVLDNRSDEATSAANLAELASDPDVSAIISGTCDQCLLSALDVLIEQGVPTITLARSDAVAAPVEERPNIFKIGPNAIHNAAVLARELERAEAQTLGLVTTSDGYGQDGQREMAAVADRAGFEVVASPVLEPNAGEEAVAAAAAEVLAYQQEPPPPDPFQQPPVEEELPPGPDAVVLWAPPPAAGGLAVALRDGGYEGELFLDAYAADELFLSGPAAAALEGARMVFPETLVIDDVIATSPAKAARQGWFQSYTARQGTYHAYSSFAADAIQVLVEAINRFDGTGRETLRDALEGTLVDGLSGPIRLRLESHSGLSPQALTTVVADGDRWRLDTR